MSELRKLRRVLDSGERDPLALDLPRSEAGQLFWSSRAESEQAAITAFSNALAAMTRSHDHADAMAAFAAIIRDEVRHTELCREVAEAFGGVVKTGESTSGELSPSAPLPVWLVANGCISETISHALLVARARHSKHAAIRDVLLSIARDEATHSRTCWLLAEAIVPSISSGERRVVAQVARSMIADAANYASLGHGAIERARDRRLRQQAADLGFGALPPDDAERLIRHTVATRVSPRLAELGLAVGNK